MSVHTYSRKFESVALAAGRYNAIRAYLLGHAERVPMPASQVVLTLDDVLKETIHGMESSRDGGKQRVHGGQGFNHHTESWLTPRGQRHQDTFYLTLGVVDVYLCKGRHTRIEISYSDRGVPAFASQRLQYGLRAVLAGIETPKGHETN